ncbi:MAG: hypothetical protein AAGU11_20715 [Syntrophobacteraceae bacterium]
MKSWKPAFHEELDHNRSKEFVDYSPVVADIVRRRSIHCGRGSGAATLSVTSSLAAVSSKAWDELELSGRTRRFRTPPVPDNRDRWRICGCMD